MLKLTKIVTDPKYWTPEMLGDAKMGLIPVFYKKTIRVAKPIFNPMSLKVITKEFAELHGESLGVYITDSNDGSGVLWWSGFCLFKNASSFPEFTDEYPNLSISHVDEVWMELFSTTPGNERYELKSLGEKKSSIRIDLAKALMLLNNLGINGIQFEEDKTVILEDTELLLGGFDAEEPAVLGNKLKEWMTDLVSACTQQTHPVIAIGSPTGPPINAAEFTALSQRIPEVLSSLIKIKK